MRHLLKPPSPPQGVSSEARTCEIHVCTPLFGGGVEAGKNDPVTLVRGPSVRGHLRFWWRATRGAKFTDVRSLKDAEGKVWGATDIPSPVSVRVEILNKGTPKACADFPPGRSFPQFKTGFPPYALFPFAGNKNEGKNPAEAAIDATFRLTLTGIDALLTHDVEPALWAWVNFGGIGARPRRGCGALFCPQLAPKGDIKQWYQSCLVNYGIVPGNSARAWPTLPGPEGIVYYPVHQQPTEAWTKVIELFKRFRQGPDVGRNPGQQQNRPGRSRWPEPDSLRRWSRQTAPMHRDPITTPQNAFPRAEFGMPVIFHFKDRGDPYPDAQLLPEGGGDRMASPLILRPLCVSNQQAYPMILRLATETIKGARVEKGHQELELHASDIRRPNLAEYPKSPMGGRTASGSALEAFMAYARQGGYK